MATPKMRRLEGGLLIPEESPNTLQVWRALPESHAKNIDLQNPGAYWTTAESAWYSYMFDDFFANPNAKMLIGEIPYSKLRDYVDWNERMMTLAAEIDPYDFEAVEHFIRETMPELETVMLYGARSGAHSGAPLSRFPGSERGGVIGYRYYNAPASGHYLRQSRQITITDEDTGAHVTNITMISGQELTMEIESILTEHGIEFESAPEEMHRLSDILPPYIDHPLKAPPRGDVETPRTAYEAFAVPGLADSPAEFHDLARGDYRQFFEGGEKAYSAPEIYTDLQKKMRATQQKPEQYKPDQLFELIGAVAPDSPFTGRAMERSKYKEAEADPKKRKAGFELHRGGRPVEIFEVSKNVFSKEGWKTEKEKIEKFVGDCVVRGLSISAHEATEIPGVTQEMSYLFHWAMLDAVKQSQYDNARFFRSQGYKGIQYRQSPDEGSHAYAYRHIAENLYGANLIKKVNVPAGKQRMLEAGIETTSKAAKPGMQWHWQEGGGRPILFRLKTRSHAAAMVDNVIYDTWASQNFSVKDLIHFADKERILAVGEIIRDAYKHKLVPRYDRMDEGLVNALLGIPQGEPLAPTLLTLSTGGAFNPLQEPITPQPTEKLIQNYLSTSKRLLEDAGRQRISEGLWTPEEPAIYHGQFGSLVKNYQQKLTSEKQNISETAKIVSPPELPAEYTISLNVPKNNN